MRSDLRGIAFRAFERRFQLADHVEVRDANVKDSLLSVALKREMPERLKPRVIQIGATVATTNKAIERTAHSPRGDRGGKGAAETPS